MFHPTKHEIHDDILADATWWLKGFKAARQTDEHDQTENLGAGLLEVREWIKGLARARTRLIGTTDRDQAFVITEGEFEILYDAIAHPSSTERDKAAGAALLKKIMDQVKTERAKSGPDHPF